MGAIILSGDFRTESELRDVGFRKLGKNVRIHSYVNIYNPENISIGDNVRIDGFTVITAIGPVEIGSHVHIANFCYLGARHGIVLEDFVGVSHGAKIFTASDDFSGAKLTGPTVPREYTGGRFGKVILKKHVIIGASSIILPGCTIGEGCSVGALSLVNRDLEPWGIYVGIPVRRIKERKKDLLILEKQLKKDLLKK